MNDLPEFNQMDPSQIPDVHSEEFKQMAINNVLIMNDHLHKSMAMLALMRAVPSVDQLTPDGWRLIMEHAESLAVCLMFLRDTLKATGSFIDDAEAAEMIKNKVVAHLRAERGNQNG